jgi:outer membrane protein
MLKKITLFFVLFLINLTLFAQKKWTLKECIEYGIENKLAIKQALLRDQQSKFNLVTAKKQLAPNLEFASSVGFNYSNFNDNLSLIDPKNINLSAWLISTTPLYLGNQLNNMIEEAKLNKRITEQQIFQLKEELVLAITNIYLDVMLKEELIKVSESQLENANNDLVRAQSLYQSGVMSEREFVEIQSSVGLRKQEMEQVKTNWDNARYNLANLLEIKEYQTFYTSTEISNENEIRTELDLDLIINEALLNRPEVLIKKVEVEKAAVMLDLSKAPRRPTLSLLAVTGTFFIQRLSGTLVNSILDYTLPTQSLGTQISDNFFNSVSLQFRVPILSRGANRIKIEQVQIEKEITEKSLEIEKNKLNQNLQRIYFDAKSATQQLILSEESEKLAKTSMDFAQKSYVNGLINIYDYNNTKTTYFQVKSRVLQAKYTSILRNKIFNYYLNGFPYSNE